MHLSVELTYAADVTTVAAVLADAEFVRWRSHAPEVGAVGPVDVAGDPGQGFTVSLRRTLPTDVIPPQLRPLVGDRVEVRQTEAWEPPVEGRHVGTIVVEFTGAPVRLTGRLLLEDDGAGGSRHRYDLDVRSSVPLFATAVEEAAASAVRGTLAAEQQAAREWLARP
ncbi:uncharacterized protein DUF2505 [Isoptericola jiangsuensis]|uniref:Uncharacterized protein DUF2505 n=1 Tax=Isoptericola jiangsuensis TaxID=548579 RepID=A0A2A9EZZ2_9MICO|nr:DUF2505 domain-containing protein [Isoptericola jiangsuensis]PFG44106.1 uncharacterized protein DUF2505 [Isoptericola jiangsuensis]